jgi:hypothetical protein
MIAWIGSARSFVFVFCLHVEACLDRSRGRGRSRVRGHRYLVDFRVRARVGVEIRHRVRVVDFGCRFGLIDRSDMTLIPKTIIKRVSRLSPTKRRRPGGRKMRLGLGWRL